MPPRVTYVAADAAAITASLVIAHLLRFGVSAALLPGPNVPYVLVAVFAVPVWLGVLALAGCYDRRILGVGSDEYRRVLNGGVHFLAVVALAHFLGRLVIARGYVGVLIPVALVLTLLTRFVLRVWLHRQRRRGRYVHRLLLVGTAGSVVEVGQHLVRSEWSGFLVVGVCVATDRPDLHIGVCVRAGRGGAVRRRRRGRRVRRGRGGRHHRVAARRAACAPRRAGGLRRHRARRSRRRRRRGSADGVARTSPASPSSTWPSRPSADRSGRPKSCSTASAPLLALLVLAPVFIVIAAAIRLDSPGPVFFRQTRVGRDGRRFSMVKFRTMVVDVDRLLADLEDRNEADGLLFKMRADPRVTRTGRVLRRYSIDELPQIINVIRGEMSMVGPRPPCRPRSSATSTTSRAGCWSSPASPACGR